SGFEDVGASAYFACPVVWAVSGGVTNGVWASSFAPHNTCTRAQILTFIWRYSGSPEPAIANPFKDVSPDNYYYKPALWAHEQGMITGREFQGSTLCTRAAAVQYLWILAGRPSVGAGKTFSDVSPGAEYAQAVSYAAERGITAGTSETEFSPNNTCTRAQIVTFLYRYHAFG
ncbi:MAG: S-layer homology domain-containing protein, partial [Oscillibacter sp.]|nr:S-layer homology domain-containing protein [Oscillibacter sp.]